MQKKYLCFLVIAIGLVFSPPRLTAQTAQSVALAWDPSPNSNVVGYVVYYGATSGVYSSTTNVSNQTSAQITGLQSGQTYFFAVTARDSLGMESVPSNEVSYQVPVATPPALALTSPIGGATYTSPASINLAASVTANGHTITKVQFYNGATLLGEVTSSPYSFTWNNVAAGGYSLTARVVYDAGSTVASSAASVTVTNPLPVVALTSPSAGATYTAPAAINLTADVTANGHAITRVQFYSGATLLGESASAPYRLAWTNVDTGNYILTARVSYDSGSTADSSPVNIAVTILSAPWQTADIGIVARAGNASESNGVYTVQGSGTIAGKADSFRFVYQSLSANGDITAQINSMATNGVNRCVGVMIRESLTPNSKYAFMGIGQNLKFRWQRRSNTGSNSSSTTSVLSTPPDAWTRLVRMNNTLTGYSSTNGVNWTKLTSASITMATNVYVGFVVASGDTSTLNTSVFSNVSVTP